MFSCDYNGWADVPEEEREGIEAFESACRTPPAPLMRFKTRVILSPVNYLPQRKAA